MSVFPSPRAARIAGVCVLLLCVCQVRAAEEKNSEDKSRLTLERIFKSSEFNGKSYGPADWLGFRDGYTTMESAKGPGGGRDIVLHDPETDATEVLVPGRFLIPPGASSPLSISGHSWSAKGDKLLIFTNTKRVWRQHTRGDYWVYDISSHALRQLGGDAAPATLMFAKFSPDAKRAAYVRENNIYVESLLDGSTTALTTDGDGKIINGTFDWVYEEELFLRDGFRWSPDGASIAYWRLDTDGEPIFHMLDNTSGLYPEVISFAYPKTGQTNADCRVGVIPSTGGTTRWLAVPGDPRNHYIARMEWAENSKELMIEQLNRLQNTNRVWMADAATGAVSPVLTERDDAWVDLQEKPRWLDGGRAFLWLSERDGWLHAYRVSRDGGSVRQVTRGDFDVISIEGVDEENHWLYFIASPGDATQRYLFRVGLDGRGLRRITPEGAPGTHTYQVSPDGQWAIHGYSNFDTPPTTEMVRLPSHEIVRVFEENTKLKKSLDALDRTPTEFFRVDIGGGVQLDGYCMRPPDFDPRKQYPVLFQVYGEPAGQTVSDRWGGSRYLWHLMLAQQGYLVMSIDNRGTAAPRGREWRKSVYRQVGILASQDQAAALRALCESRPYIDPSRVGIWGWSGGGSMTLNMLFRYPDLYKVGMAVAPVPNMRLYDTIYQERYMGLPNDNAEGYLKGSPLTYAAQLEDDLLIVHGTGDDNVHFQGTEALINELVANEKQFTMMAYPMRTHGIGEGVNTTRHLYALLTNFLHDHLPAGPRPLGNKGN